MSITPGGNQVCETCGCWFMSPAGKHDTINDCVEKLTSVYQSSGPDEFPTGYYRYLAKKHLGLIEDVPIDWDDWEPK